MIGHPKYTYNDVVTFKCDITGDGNLVDVIGTVEVVDSYGTFFDDSDVQYDVLGTFNATDDDGNPIASSPIFFKHILESQLTLVERHDAKGADVTDTDDKSEQLPVDTEPFKPRQSTDEMKRIGNLTK